MKTRLLKRVGGLGRARTESVREGKTYPMQATLIRSQELMPLLEASVEADVSKDIIIRMINSGEVAKVDRPGHSGIFIHRSDLPKIIESKSKPGPGDPTPEQIRERCQRVRAERPYRDPKTQRETALRKTILELLVANPCLTVGAIASAARISCSLCHRVLSEMSNLGLVERQAGHTPIYSLPDGSADSAGMESAESILARFKANAKRCVSRPRCIAA